MTTFTRWMAKILLLPTFAVAAAIWIKGYSSVGGGFAAGVTLSAIFLLQYLVWGHQAVDRSIPLWIAPYLTIAGLIIVILIVMTPVFFGYPVLSHFPRTGKPIVELGDLELTTSTLFDFGVLLIVFGFTVNTARHFAHEGGRQDQ